MPGKSYAITSPDDTIKPYVAFSTLYDSNFFRRPNNVDSEIINKVNAGFDMDWTISRQHIIIKANANQNWFQNFTNLDYTGWDTQAQWNWQIGNHLDGEMGYANSQALGSFAQLGSPISNLQNNQRYFANAGYLFHPNGKIKFGVFRNEIVYDKSREFSNNTEDNAELNLRYLSPTGSILGLRLLAVDGQYPQRQFSAGDTEDNAYTRFNYAVTWDWYVSSKTRIDGSFGYTQQHHAHLSIRDFADITTQLNLHWQASDKTLLELSAKREINQASNQSASFLLTQGVEFKPTWQPSPKIALTLPVSYQQQQFLGNSGSNSTDGFQQKDNVGSIGFNLMYRPFDNISIGAVLNYEKRDSNIPPRSYEAQSAGINIQAVF